MAFSKKNVYASIPATARGKAVLLGGDPKGKNFLYTCGQSVIIRNIENPLIAETYDEHARPPTVARYSPSGFYIASADSTGTVRIWDTTQAEHPLKIELQVLSGPIYDLAWTPDSQRIVVGGEGREKYGHAFIWDTGASVGEISGHAKPIYSVDAKPSRPFRVVTGSEDFAMNWYAGPPFKYQHAIKEHTRFVNCVRFSPNGELLASAGSDKKVFLYGGKDGDKKLELAGEAPHTGGVYSLSWSPDNSKVLTSSADRSAKIWDVSTGTCLTTFHLGEGTDHQQVGSLWQGQFLLSVNLAGHISYLDPNNNAAPTRVVKGHNKFVTALAYDRDNAHIFSGSYDSVITKWNVHTGETFSVEGEGHKNKIESAVVDSNHLVTGAMDDSVRVTPLNPLHYANSIGVDSPVSAVDSVGGNTVAVSMNKVYLIRNGSIVTSEAVAGNPKSVAINPAANLVAVGTDDNLIHLYNVNGNALQAKSKLEGHRGGITSLAFAPDGHHLASGSKDRAVYVWDVNSGELKQSGWKFHSAVVNSVAWSPNSRLIASASLDQNVFIWDTQNPATKTNIAGAHRSGANKVVWADDKTLLSSGQDCCVKSWNVNIA